MAMIMRRPTGRSGGLRRSNGNTLRPVEWIRDCEHEVALPPGAPLGIVLVTAAEFDDFTRPTVVRIRGELTLHLTDVTLGNQSLVTWGITIVNPAEPAPDPFLERRGNRWLWWGCFNLINPPGPTLGFVDGVSWKSWPFDIKSMRKRMVDGSTLQLSLTSGGPADVSATVGASTLVKE